MSRVLVFGSVGQGKSSLVNLLAGRNVADVGHGARIGTFETTEHHGIVAPDGHEYTLVDTAGLNEASSATTEVSPRTAMENLRKLLLDSRAKGFCLAILVTKADRFEGAFQDNYETFVEKFLSVAGIPVILVRLGLDIKPFDKWFNDETKHILAVNYADIKGVIGGTCADGLDDPDMEALIAVKRNATKEKVWCAIKDHRLREDAKLDLGSIELILQNVWNSFCNFMSNLTSSAIWRNLLWVNDSLQAFYLRIYSDPAEAREKAAETQSGL